MYILMARQRGGPQRSWDRVDQKWEENKNCRLYSQSRHCCKKSVMFSNNTRFRMDGHRARLCVWCMVSEFVNDHKKIYSFYLNIDNGHYLAVNGCPLRPNQTAIHLF